MPELAHDVSLVICTKNRPEELARLIDSVLRQVPLPGEIVVVDDGRLPAVPHAAEIRAGGIHLVYHRKDRPGICRSRNIGADLAARDLVMYLDDDVVLEPGYIAFTVREFHQSEEVVGVRGISTTAQETNHRRNPGAWRALERLFLLRGRGHRVLASGFANQEWEGFTEAADVPFLTGCTTYRRRLFQRHRYDEGLEALAPYAFGEDLAFSWQVGREGLLRVVPQARLAHRPSPHARTTHCHLARLRLHNQYRIYRTCFRGGPGRPAAFAWAVTGKVVLASLGLALQPSRATWDILCGTVSGAWLVARQAVGGNLPAVTRPTQPPAQSASESSLSSFDTKSRFSG